MRINLDCPFEDKDQVRVLGARWDGHRKVWYIENVEDLTPFMRWITGSASMEPARKTSVLTRKGKTTVGRNWFTPCNCAALAWEDCEHTSEIRGAGPAPLTDLARELDHQAREHMRSMT